MYQRVFILEVSGPTLAFIRERLPHLPNLRRLVEQGASGQLSCPLQPMLPNAFGTLYTGCNPGQCGLYDFFGFAAGGYERLPYSSTRLQRPTFLSHLAAHGKRVGMLNTPLLYPLPEVDGFVVSGDEDAGEAFARPKAIQRLLEDRGYRVAFGASYAPGREIAFFEHCLQVMAMRVDALRALFGARDWQFGMLTLHWIGELLHAFWKFYDPRHPDYRPFGEVFGQTDPFLEALILIDTLVGELDELVGAEGLLLVFGAWGTGSSIRRSIGTPCSSARAT